MDSLILAARGLTFRYPGAATNAVEGVDFDLKAGELVAVLGPNGSGKTTLLRLLLGVLTPDRGTVTIQDREASQWDRRSLARLVGVVVQREEPAFPLRAGQAVALGRYPHLSPFASPGPADRRAVDSALARADVAGLVDRWVATLSGGEWQRVRIARALAQEPRALALDEATANLDLRHEMETFELLAELTTREGLGVLLVTHHVNLAARYADRIVVLDRGRVVSSGRPSEALTQQVMERVFQWPVTMTQWAGAPQMVPLKNVERGNR
ncbi:MAG: ABC transporter ATP-binding protein [Gemmatimonadetes bacterium]|nr:ABC transporter ATP-binding protein [Gemmatimonadota bacterium]